MSQSAKCPTFFLTHPVHFSLLSLDVLKMFKKITNICYHKNINFSKEHTVIHLLSSPVVQSEYCKVNTVAFNIHLIRISLQKLGSQINEETFPLIKEICGIQYLKALCTRIWAIAESVLKCSLYALKTRFSEVFAMFRQLPLSNMIF